MNNSGEWPECG